jgi:pyridoxamine 5'-phosphate oxidase family protein
MTSSQPEPVFTDAEREYLNSQRLGRLVTLDRNGAPQVRPVGFSLAGPFIEVGGYNLPTSQKFRNIIRDPRVAFVVDDLASIDPWRARGVEVRGTAQALPAAGDNNPVIRIRPQRIIAWGLAEGTAPASRDAN